MRKLDEVGGWHCPLEIPNHNKKRHHFHEMPDLIECGQSVFFSNTSLHGLIWDLSGEIFIFNHLHSCKLNWAHGLSIWLRQGALSPGRA